MVLLSGCPADEPRDERAGEAGMVAVLPVLPVPAAEVDRLCSGAPLLACDGPFTGASCELPCIGGTASIPGACGLDSYCHSNGAVYGLAARNAILYHGAPDDTDTGVEGAFKGWIIDHELELGLEPELEREHIELRYVPHSRSSAGPLTLHRFSQTYRGFPVLAPDGVVTLVHGPQGAISISGAIIDNRTPYAHASMQASAATAEHSILHHASAHAHVSIDALEVVHATRVAMPMGRAIGWAGFVRREGGTTFARVIVDADPSISAPVLPLWSYRELGASGLANTQQIQVHTLDPAGEPANVMYSDETTLTTGAPLLGSVDDGTLEIQLATERVVVLDLHEASLGDLAISGTRVLDPGGSFLANTGTELSAQFAYHRFQSWYDYIDGLLTDPFVGAKRWDSANDFYTNGTLPSDTPAGTFAPRVLGFVNANSDDCPVMGAACASQIGFAPGSPEAMAFPELVHIPVGATNPEVLGRMILPGTGIEPVTFAHEFGHIIDLFTGGGITWDFAPACAGACGLECIEDTSDEAPPLTESIAQLLALVFLRQSFELVDFDYCDIVNLVSRNGLKAWTPGPCIPPGEDISLFQRLDACAKPDAYCDKPEAAGFSYQCCFEDEDLTDCTVLLPADCPVSAMNSSGAMGTGTGRVVPTGLCHQSPGYQTNSLYQAFWQLLNGQLCEATPPFACVSVEWAPGVVPMDAATSALLYAMRVNALTYEQLFDAMATYVSCTYGDDAYDDFNTIACNHGIRDCAAPAPLVCQMCGNGVREGNEGCDGTDWLLTRCEDLPLYLGRNAELRPEHLRVRHDAVHDAGPGHHRRNGNTRRGFVDLRRHRQHGPGERRRRLRVPRWGVEHELAPWAVLVRDARRDTPKADIMTYLVRATVVVVTACLTGCHCASADGQDTDRATSTSEESTGISMTSSEASTGEPFDASRWLGRYHYENVFLPFGERGEHLGSAMLINFEVFADSTAVMFYDPCVFDEPIIINYTWMPGEPGWLDLRPGEGEASLRFLSTDNLETLRVQLIESCRELAFEVDGWVNSSVPFHPGESCWVDRCTTPGIMQVDYCEGEEPPPCP
jgi:hypothetical protein